MSSIRLPSDTKAPTWTLADVEQAYGRPMPRKHDAGSRRDASDGGGANFEAWMGLMRDPSPLTQEHGFHLLRVSAAEHVPELIRELRAEQDPGLCCWLLELLGVARSADTVAVFARYLDGDNPSYRYWADAGLRELGTTEALQAVLQHRLGTSAHTKGPYVEALLSAIEQGPPRVRRHDWLDELARRCRAPELRAVLVGWSGHEQQGLDIGCGRMDDSLLSPPGWEGKATDAGGHSRQVLCPGGGRVDPSGSVALAVNRREYFVVRLDDPTATVDVVDRESGERWPGRPLEAFLAQHHLGAAGRSDLSVRVEPWLQARLRALWTAGQTAPDIEISPTARHPGDASPQNHNAPAVGGWGVAHRWLRGGDLHRRPRARESVGGCESVV